jgi:hypothetical protein
MEEAKLVAVSSYRLVLEDVPEIETPDQSSDDHGDVLDTMYTPDMLDEKEQAVPEMAVMSKDHTGKLREPGAGGSGTV